MSKRTVVVMPETQRILETMGEQIKMARLRRNLATSGVEFIEIERKKVDNIPISASAVRKLIKDENIEGLKNIIPIQYSFNNPANRRSYDTNT